ncbi:sulfatase-like hydrolase/transferase [Kordiimonas aquimaris]|uniref:sulfatase-like hydrolase/transferase n=1 Tax=Kordiimonas aquimaris TaxID=707591 RepID=UPI0021CFC16C|nr:sulfatase-like hydrolase/transferase [Kordiimonas aquimaris]
MYRLFILPIASLIFIFTSPSLSSETNDQPNIIFILVDDLGWGDVGYHGGDIYTPNIDSIAQKSIKLERHYVHPYCLPTRLAFFTGDYPGRTNNSKPVDQFTGNLPERSLPRSLSSLGYETFIVGKWHLGNDKSRGPLQYGFSHSYGAFDAHADPYFHDTASGQHVWHRNDIITKEEGHATDLLTDEALRVVTGKRHNPYFLYLAYTAPHWPLDAPQNWKEFYAQTNIKNADYASMVSHLDENIGRLFVRIQETQNERDTIVIFSSDNGAEARSAYTDNVYDGVYGKRYGVQTAFGSNGLLKGAKGSVYEGGVRVPAFVWWEGLEKPRTINTPLQIEDWFPTILDIAGASIQYHGPGKNIRDILTGVVSSSWNREFYTRSTWPHPMWALRDGPLKMVVSLKPNKPWLQSLAKAVLPKSQEWRINKWFGNYDIADSSRLKFEFYNVQLDPSEENDISEAVSYDQKQKFITKLNAYRSGDTNLNTELCIPAPPVP